MKNHQNFFEKALEIQAKRQEKLSEAEKKEIALQLGFSEEDWQAVIQSFTAHLERGKAFLERQNYTEAITELQEALIIQPENTEALSQIASAYLELFQHKKRKQDKEKALQFARECLQYAPTHPLAHQVIDAFNPTKSAQPKTEALPHKQVKKPYKVEVKKHTYLEEEDDGIPADLFVETKKKHRNPLEEIGLFVGVVGGFLLFFYLTFPRFPHTTQHKTQHKTEQSTSNTTQATTPKADEYKVSEEASRLSLVLECENTDYRVEPQANGAILVKNTSGEKLFSLTPHYSVWKIYQHTWTGDAWKGKAKYDFAVEGVLELQVFIKNLAVPLSFPAKILDASNSPFYTDFGKQNISTETMPDDFVYYPEHPTFIKFRLPVLRQGITFEDELPFERKEKPTQLLLTLQNLRFANPPVFESKEIPVFYKGESYGLPLYQVTEASGYEPSGGIFAYRWAFVIKHNAPARKLKYLKVKVKFFDKNDREIRLLTDGWSSEVIYEADFPPMTYGKFILRGFSHDLRGIKQASEVARKEVHIEEMVWDK